MTNITADVPTPKGNIRAVISEEGGRLHLELEVPDGLKEKLMLWEKGYKEPSIRIIRKQGVSIFSQRG